MKKKILITVVLILLILAGTAVVFKDDIQNWFFRPTESNIEAGIKEALKDEVSIYAEKLDTPWSMTFLPNNDMLLTERSGNVKRLGQDGKTFPIAGVRETSEGGLLGIVLDPEFEQNDRLYLYMTTEQSGQLENRIDTYALKDDQLTYQQTILAGIPAASNHNGGGIAFGPDGKLYVTTGDAAQDHLAQDKNSLAGKILRLNKDGSVPADNPFGNYVWSYGHRNPQGIAWDEQGRMWSVEHGPSGFGGTGQDELNLIEKAANYGWPTVTGDKTAQDMREPVIHSGPSETWAPAALVYYDGSLYFAGLRGQSLYQAKINDDASVSLMRHFSGLYGRLRAVARNDQNLFFSTSNRDGRGSPADNDDRIIKIQAAIFNP